MYFPNNKSKIVATVWIVHLLPKVAKPYLYSAVARQLCLFLVMMNDCTELLVSPSIFHCLRRLRYDIHLRLTSQDST